MTSLDPLGDDPVSPEPPISQDLNKPMCGLCMRDDRPLRPARCDERPEGKLGFPYGMYHCPECGAMVVAGFPHPHLCDNCQPKEEA